MLPRVEDRDLFAAAFASIDAIEMGRSMQSEPNELTEGVRVMRVAIATVPNSSWSVGFSSWEVTLAFVLMMMLGVLGLEIA